MRGARGRAGAGQVGCGWPRQGVGKRKGRGIGLQRILPPASFSAFRMKAWAISKWWPLAAPLHCAALRHAGPPPASPQCPGPLCPAPAPPCRSRRPWAPSASSAGRSRARSPTPVAAGGGQPALSALPTLSTLHNGTVNAQEAGRQENFISFPAWWPCPLPQEATPRHLPRRRRPAHRSEPGRKRPQSLLDPMLSAAVCPLLCPQCLPPPTWLMMRL